MDKLVLIQQALSDLFPNEDFSHVSAEMSLRKCSLESNADASELGISIENVLIDQYDISNPPDMDQLFNLNMTVQDCISRLDEVIE